MTRPPAPVRAPPHEDAGAMASRSSWTERPRWWPVAVVVAVAGITAALGQLAWKSSGPGLLDFQIYVGAARQWWEGWSLYSYADDVYGLSATYPPAGILVFLPFVALPIGAARLVWTLVEVVLLFVMADLALALVPGLDGAQRHWRALLVGGASVATAPVWETFNQGQVNLLLWVLVLADFVALARGRSRAGIGIGVATALKLTPGLFVVVLALARRWRAALTAMVTAGGVTLVAGLIAPGDTRTYFTSLLWDTGRVGDVDDPRNNSLWMLAAHVHPAALVVPAVVAVGALCVGAGLWVAAQRLRDGAVLDAALLTGLVGSLVTPISWTHHLVVVVVAAVWLWQRFRPPWWAWVIGWVLAVDPVGWGSAYPTTSVRMALLVALGAVVVLAGPAPRRDPAEPGAAGVSTMT